MSEKSKFWTFTARVKAEVDLWPEWQKIAADQAYASPYERMKRQLADRRAQEECQEIERFVMGDRTVQSQDNP